MVGALAMGLPSALAASVNLQAMMERDVEEIEDRLKLAGDKLAKVDRIMREAVAKRMAVLREHNVTPGVRPPILTLITVKAEMDKIRAEIDRELLKVLSEPEMHVVEEMAEHMRQKIRSIILGR
jgi:hypothetical protein